MIADIRFHSSAQAEAVLLRMGFAIHGESHDGGPDGMSREGCVAHRQEYPDAPVRIGLPDGVIFEAAGFDGYYELCRRFGLAPRMRLHDGQRVWLFYRADWDVQLYLRSACGDVIRPFCEIADVGSLELRSRVRRVEALSEIGVQEMESAIKHLRDDRSAPSQPGFQGQAEITGKTELNDFLQTAALKLSQYAPSRIRP